MCLPVQEPRFACQFASLTGPADILPEQGEANHSYGDGTQRETYYCIKVPGFFRKQGYDYLH